MREHNADFGQVFFYLLVGGSTALIYVLVCMTLSHFGVSPGLSSVAGYLLVILPAYFGQKELTFRSSTWHRVALPKYLALQAAGNIAGYFLSNYLAESGSPRLVVFCAVAVMIAATNFAILKYWTFRARA
jgi:putative flippase GtrA